MESVVIEKSKLNFSQNCTLKKWKTMDTRGNKGISFLICDKKSSVTGEAVE